MSFLELANKNSSNNILKRVWPISPRSCCL